jgi:thioredoxin 1
MANITEVNDNNFNSMVIEAGGKVMVDFWAPWCGPCRMQSPILEKLVQSGAIKAKIYKLNTDESPNIAQKYDISSIPTLIIFDGGKEIDRLIGLQTENALKDKLK